jgi:hypothetical protein
VTTNPAHDVRRAWPRAACGLAGFLACAGARADPAPLELARDGTSEYVIVISATGAASYAYAASELQSHLRATTGAAPGIVTDDRERPPKAILLGRERHVRELIRDGDFDALGSGGFILRQSGDDLVIAGHAEEGTLNGVYELLEKQAGCRWYAPGVSLAPRTRRLVLPAGLDERCAPKAGWREVYYRAVLEDPMFAARLRLNGNYSLSGGRPERPSGSFAGWGNWCHTLHSYVPPERHFADHPEYFALRDGKRVPQQLCLSNPEVLRLTIESLRRKIEARPACRLWDVSQMDGGGNCQCDACRAIDEQEGGPMGSILAFVNQVARAFPDRTLSTLSYFYSQHVTRTLKPGTNVVIKLCMYGLPCQIPYETQEAGDLVRDWSRVADQLCIWDYHINFAHLFAPHPNFRTLPANYRLYANHHATALFAQGNREIGGEFCELRAYVLAKLLWNPDTDVDVTMDDFLQGYYGPAAASIRRYLDAMHDELAASGVKLDLYSNPMDHARGFLRPEMLERYAGWFDEAESLVAGDPSMQARVRTARMPLQYAMLTTGCGSPDDRAAVLRDFLALCQTNGIARLSETGLPPAQFNSHYTERLALEKAATKSP